MRRTLTAVASGRCERIHSITGTAAVRRRAGAYFTPKWVFSAAAVAGET